MLKLKTKPEAPARGYVPRGLLRPNLDELRNGFTPETLTASMRATCHNDYEFSLLRLVRAKDDRDRAVVALAQFHRNAYPRDAKFKATLARLQQTESETANDYEHALALRDVALEAA